MLELKQFIKVICKTIAILDEKKTNSWFEYYIRF